MYPKRLNTLLTLFLAISIAVLSQGVAAVQAAAPANDDFDFATPIGSLPFSDAVNTTEASLAGDDPVSGCMDLVYDKTVWYSFTSAYDTGVSIGRSGSDYRADAYVYTGSRGSLTQVAGYCDEMNNEIRFLASAGTTYYIMVAAGRYFWEGPPSGGSLFLNITELPLPSNDNFSGASIISSIPFQQGVDVQFATSEGNEPVPSCWGSASHSIWFAYTAPNAGLHTALANFEGGGAVAIYTGDALENLAELACGGGFGYSGPVTLQLQAGVTYYIQVVMTESWWGWGVTFQFGLTPPPHVEFYYDPNDPSKFDTIQFLSSASDPVGTELSFLWDFGDGATSTEPYPFHRYPADGDYTVQLTATTPDGRSATISKTVQVRTHDVAITRFIVPQSAAVGQTRQITVYVNNKYIDEIVEVGLFKSTPRGYVQVGSLTLFVPYRPTNRAVPFAFSYTFRPEDAEIGKVTFRAMAIILEAHDALPADNEVNALPTRVTR